MNKFGLKKSFFILSLMAVALLSACSNADPNRKKANEEYQELVKTGKLHDAMIVKVDSLTNKCTYSFQIGDKTYTGQCNQIEKTPFSVEDIILVVYLERDPFVSRRYSTESR